MMVWFFLIPSIPTTFGNFIVPLMIGARDLAFPRLNLTSWYLFMLGGADTLYAVFVGGIDTGWTFYTPFSTMYSNSHVVLAVTGVFIAGFSSILTGLNFIVTIHRLRAPGLTWYRLPLFLWSLYATSVILVLATPVLAMTLLLDRARPPLRHRHFRSARRRRSAAVPASVLVLLASRRLHHDPAGHGRGQRAGRLLFAQGRVRLQVRRLVGHRHRRRRLLRLGPPHVRQRAIAFCRAGVFVHELHRRGAFGDQGVQLDRHDAQRLDRFDAPMLYALGFIGLFTIGGLTGLFLACLAYDVYVTDTYFVVAHFHYIMVGGMVTAYFGGLHYWWPKITGRHVSGILGARARRS